MLRALAPAVLVVVLSGSLAACSGDDDPASGSDDPSTAATAATAASGASGADFCAALEGVAAAYGAVDPETFGEQDVVAIKAAVTELVEVGAPAEMSEDAQVGFELVTSEVLDLADDATIEELKSAGEDFSGADDEKADAFDDHVDQACDASGDDE